MTYALTFLMTFVVLWAPPVNVKTEIDPLGLRWGVQHKAVPKLENFKYYFGDPTWGKIVYLGIEDIAGIQTELQIEYVYRRPAVATIIFGPAGIGITNCFSRYKEMIKFLNQKHGHYQYQKENRDSLQDDLLHVYRCEPISLNLTEVGTIWNTPKFRIEAWLYGVDGEIFIEIEYSFSPLDGQIKDAVEKGLQKIL